MFQTAQVPPAPPHGPAPSRGGRRAAQIGAVLIVIGLVAGIGLVTYGFAATASPELPQPVAPTATILATEDGQQFAIYRLGEGAAEACRVTTAAGTAVSVSRSPGSVVTIGDVRYQIRATFAARKAGVLTVDCPDAAMLFVGPRQSGGQNVVAIVAGLLVGAAMVIAGLIVALVGAVVSAGGRGTAR